LLTWEEVLAMSVRSALYMPAFVFLAVALLIVVAGCGAIITFFTAVAVLASAISPAEWRPRSRMKTISRRVLCQSSE
jgi:hypothetical protein